MSEVNGFKLVPSVLVDRILKDQCVSTAQLDQLSKASSPELLHFVCTALPGPSSECVFVELETSDGNGSGLGEWITRPDGLVALVVPTSQDRDAQRLRADTAEAERDDLQKRWESTNSALQRRNLLNERMQDRLDDRDAMLRAALPAVKYESKRGDDAGQQYRLLVEKIDAAINQKSEGESQ